MILSLISTAKIAEILYLPVAEINRRVRRFAKDSGINIGSHNRHIYTKLNPEPAPNDYRITPEIAMLLARGLPIDKQSILINFLWFEVLREIEPPKMLGGSFTEVLRMNIISQIREDLEYIRQGDNRELFIDPNSIQLYYMRHISLDYLCALSEFFSSVVLSKTTRRAYPSALVECYDEVGIISPEGIAKLGKGFYLNDCATRYAPIEDKSIIKEDK